MDEVVLDPAFAPMRPSDVRLEANQLHVWAVPLSGDPRPFGALLSAAERQRLERFQFADHRRRYEIGHGALRLLLAAYMGEDATAIEFVHGPRGKPYVSGRGPFFNLSHSGKLALIGFADAELGVDLEKVRHLESLVEIARRHFSAREWAALSALDEPARELAFYRCWTRKEAYIKALGEGLSMPLDLFDVSLCAEPKLLDCREGREHAAAWSMLDISPGAEYVAAAALRAHGVDLRCFRFAGA